MEELTPKSDVPDEFEKFVEHLRTFDGAPSPNDPLVRIVDGKTFVYEDGQWLEELSREEFERRAALGRAAIDRYIAAKNQQN